MNYIITKEGNYGVIRPAPIGSLAATLDKYMQYTRQNEEYTQWPIVKFYKTYKRTNTGQFPWGLLLTTKAIFDKHCEISKDSYILKVPELPSSEIPDLIGLREYQRETVRSLVKHKGGIIVIPCGGGKTITLIEYLKLMNLPALVIVPSIDIRKQWDDFNLKNLVASTYQNSKLKLKGTKGKLLELSKIVLAKELSQYRIVVFDECHHTAAKSLYNIAMHTATDAILIGATATINRDDGEEMRINAALGEIIYTIERKELIRQGYLANARVVYLTPQFKSNGKYTRYPVVYKNEIVENQSRNNLIVATAIRETQNHRKILILVNTLDHQDILMQLFNMPHNLPITNNLKIIVMNGNSKDRDQDMSVYDIIIATSIYDEGYNLPSLDTLILAGSGKSTIKLIQRIGRVLRLKPDGREAIIYDFVDLPKYLDKQYKERRKLLEQEFEVTVQSNQRTLI